MSHFMLEHVSCNLCGADQPIVIYPFSGDHDVDAKENEFRSSGDEPLKNPLVKCSVCGFQYVNPRISSEQVLKGYINSVDETFVSQSKGREITFKRCLSKIERVWKKKPARILDVGTANGSFLKVAKDSGWQVAGCEPNRWMCRWCWNNYGIEITQGTIFDGNYGDATFEVVTLWDVLEHTPDPMATLRECVRVLSPNGLLVVNYPDIGSWIARLMGQKWVFLLSVHYYYYTRQTIRRAIKLAGLELITIEPHYQTLEFDYMLFRAAQYVGPLADISRSVMRCLGVNKAQFPYWIGQTLVIAQKKR